MVMLGVLTLLIIAIAAFLSESPDGKMSSLIAIGFFFIMLGLAFFYPDMLRSETKDTISTMRVVVYMIVSVFVFLSVKIGWSAEGFRDFVLDRTWAWILAITLGSKAIQSLGENNWLARPRNTEAPPTTGRANILFPSSTTNVQEDFDNMLPTRADLPTEPPPNVSTSKMN